MGSTSLEKKPGKGLSGAQNNDGTWDLPEFRQKQLGTGLEVRGENSAFPAGVWKL